MRYCGRRPSVSEKRKSNRKEEIIIKIGGECKKVGTNKSANGHIGDDNGNDRGEA